jgi:hypothetical protein
MGARGRGVQSGNVSAGLVILRESLKQLRDLTGDVMAESSEESASLHTLESVKYFRKSNAYLSLCFILPYATR